MRKSHLIVAGLGLSAAAVTGSALTAENTIANTVAGYGESAISGAVVTEIDYVTLAADATYLDEVAARRWAPRSSARSRRGAARPTRSPATPPTRRSSGSSTPSASRSATDA